MNRTTRYTAMLPLHFVSAQLMRATRTADTEITHVLWLPPEIWYFPGSQVCQWRQVFAGMISFLLKGESSNLSSVAYL